MYYYCYIDPRLLVHSCCNIQSCRQVHSHYSMYSRLLMYSHRLIFCYHPVNQLTSHCLEERWLIPKILVAPLPELVSPLPPAMRNDQLSSAASLSVTPSDPTFVPLTRTTTVPGRTFVEVFPKRSKSRQEMFAQSWGSAISSIERPNNLWKLNSTSRFDRMSMIQRSSV